MKVSELISLLQSQDPDTIVVLSKDEEGNGFSELEDYGTGNWGAEEKEFHDSDHSADDCCMNEDEYNEMRKLPKCLVLWP